MSRDLVSLFRLIVDGFFIWSRAVTYMIGATIPNACRRLSLCKDGPLASDILSEFRCRIEMGGE